MNRDKQCVKVLYENTEMLSCTFNVIEASLIDAVPGFTLCHAAGASHVFDYIVKGNGIIRHGSEEVPVSAGSVCIIRSGFTVTLHTDNKNPLNILRIIVSGSFIDNLVNTCAIDSVSISTSISHTSSDEETKFRKMLDLLSKIDNSYKIDIQKEITQHLFSVMTDIKENEIFVETCELSNTALKMKNHIDSNIYNDVSLDDLTAKFGITKMHVIRLFKKDYGITPMQYIINKKTDIAKSLLAESNIAIKDISEILKYSNTQHFSNSFKKCTGYSPKQYRNMNNPKNENN